MFLILTFLLSSFSPITFKSQDQLLLTGDLYMPHEKEAPFIILFHQAGFSRGEYREIAPILNQLGFNCLAIDQRSGQGVNDIINETASRAKAKGVPTNYIDAMPDLKAAVSFVKEKYAKGKLIIWGSSYSAALVLCLAGENPESVDAVLAFSPGEYLQKQGEEHFVQKTAEKITCPVFITSAADEKEVWWPIFQVIKDKKEYFLPSEKGIHGSRALWKSTPEHQLYWQAVEKFLEQFEAIKP